MLHDTVSNRQNKLCTCHMKIYLSLLVRLRESSNGKTTCVFREEHISTKLVKKKKKEGEENISGGGNKCEWCYYNV